MEPGRGGLLRAGKGGSWTEVLALFIEHHGRKGFDGSSSKGARGRKKGKGGVFLKKGRNTYKKHEEFRG